MSTGINQKREWYFNVFLLIILFTAINFYIHRREIVNPFIVEPDIGLGYITYFFSEPALLKNDLFRLSIDQCLANGKGLFLENSLLAIPLLYYFLLSCPLTVFPLITKSLTLSQILAFVSIAYSVTAVLFVYKIGCLFSGKKWFALSLALFFLIYSSTMDAFYGGLQRGVGFAVICAFYYYLCRDRIIGLIACIFLSLLFDPHILPLLVIATSIHCYARRIKGVYSAKNALYFLIVSGLTAIFLYLIIYNFHSDLKVYLFNHMQWKWLLKTDFSRNEVISFVGNFVLNIHEHSLIYKYFTLFLSFSALVFLFLRPKKAVLTGGDKVFIFSSFTAFFLLLPLQPGVASRQLIFSLPLFLIIFFWKKAISVSLSRSIIFLLLFSGIFIAFNRCTNELADFTKRRIYFDFFSYLPKNTLIAGHPESLRYIPFFSKRSVYFDPLWEENMLSFFDKKKQDEFKERKAALIKFIYSRDIEGFKKFIINNQVTHLIINEFYYSDSYLYRQLAWDTMVKAEISNLIIQPKDGKDNYLVLNIGRTCGIRLGEGIYILDCQKFIQTSDKLAYGQAY
jgi:hypothetical protein